MRRPWIALALLLVGLPGCGAGPAATLLARSGAATAGPKASLAGEATAVSQPALPGVAAAAPQTFPHGPASAVAALPNPGPLGLVDAEAEPEEGIADAADAPRSDVAPAAPGPTRTAAYAAAARADAQGQPLGEVTSYEEPTYLTPRFYPVILPGSPAPLPAFTPRPVDVSMLPTDAFVELDRLGRLRDRKRGLFAWLVGYSFPKITATTARSRLASGGPVWLAPSGSHWHRDRAYAEVREARTIEAMLEELRRAALDTAAREAREANIEGRSLLLPAFNGTFDVYKLWLAEHVVDGFTYGGQPVRRGVVTAAGLLEQRLVKRRIATYWEDHPTCTAAELRHVTTSVLVGRFDDIRRSASTYAANPAVYADAQLIPGLRDPRPVVEGDRRWYDLDVRYNEDAIRSICTTMPQVLRGAMYPVGGAL
ncbi:MAG: hypothetical protein VKS61_15935 [Candidatus Sericytochromatia bacterium]|nr:hypothetical protein [Candidatus Sericytochromatia bacterium]